MPSGNPEKHRILQKITEREGLPSASPLVVRLLELATDERASTGDLAAVIEQDPGLTTRLLKIANSAFFSGPRKAATVSQAILLVGHTRLRIMALSLSLRDSFPFGKVHGLDYEFFWKTSLYRAFIAQGLSQQMPRLKTAQIEEAFTAGLLQEIGMPMLHHASPESVQMNFPAASDPLDTILSWEEQTLGIHHRQVGHYVLKRWGFPKIITESQQYYGPDIPVKDRPVLARVLEFARLATQVFFSERQQFEVLRENALILDLDYEQISDTLCTSFSRVAEIAQYFQLNVDAGRDTVEVIEKANRTLVKMNDSLQINLGKAMGLLSEDSRRGETDFAQTINDQRRTVGNILDAVAHEIRNPLMAIGGFAQRLAREVDGDSQSARYLSIIVQEAGRLQQVLREVSRFSEGFTPALDEMDLTAIIEESIRLLEDTGECRNVAFVRSFPQDARTPARLDPGSIKLALQLILKTIAQLAGPHRDKAEIVIRIRESSAPEFVLVDFSAGKGTFQRSSLQVLLDADFSSKTLGKGLDFLQAWKIIESHRGRIEIQNAPDGSHLIVSLPHQQ